MREKGDAGEILQDFLPGWRGFEAWLRTGFRSMTRGWLRFRAVPEALLVR